MTKEGSVSSTEQSKLGEEHTSTSQSDRFIAKAQELGSDEREEVSDTRTQAQKFEQAAREHGADGDEEAFKSVLRKLAKPK